MHYKIKIKKPPRDWLSVLILVIMVYLLVNTVLPKTIGGFFGTYVIGPAAWGVLAFFVTRLKRQKSIVKRRLRGLLIKIAIVIAILQVYFSLIAGFLDKFGKSPNSFTVIGIMLNLIFMGSRLIGIELSRAWLINRIARKPSNYIPVLIALFYTFMFIPLNKFPNINSSLEATTKFFGSHLLPVFMENLTASFLALWGGPLPALIYSGLLQAFYWFCPVLPDLNWAMKAFTGTVVPVMGLVFTQHLLKLNSGKNNKVDSKQLVNVTIISVVSIIAIWFSVGVFPVHPTVIISGSMRPTFEVGDIAIVAKVNPNLIKVGDIIQFHTVDRPIPTIHRVIEIQGKKENQKSLITQGDANNTPDDPVQPKQIAGKVIFRVPKAGWTTIVVRELFS